jgi:hypothetical protein
MPWKELYAVACAATTWGHLWKAKRIIIRSDSATAVAAWKKGSSIDNDLSELIRTLLFLASIHSFELKLVHIAGIDNCYADLLSRGQVADFLALPGTRFPLPDTPLPPPIHSW